MKKGRKVLLLSVLLQVSLIESLSNYQCHFISCLKIYIFFVFTGCLKEYGTVANYQYFNNGNTQQGNIFRHNFNLIINVKCTNVMNMRGMMGQIDFDYKTTNL